jgi:hypothetical protein
MWGPSIVGYGSYRYTYESGRTGEAPLTGFAIRGRELVIYLIAEGDRQKSLLSKLGKHKMGKTCCTSNNWPISTSRCSSNSSPTRSLT